MTDVLWKRVDATTAIRPLSDRQQAILDYVRSTVAGKGYPPSVREICKAVGIRSTSTVYEELRRIEARGHAHIHNRKARGIRLVTS